MNLTLQYLENLQLTEFASQWGYDLAILLGRGLLLQNVLRYSHFCEYSIFERLVDLKISQIQSSDEYKIGKASSFSKEEIASFKTVVVDAGEVAEAPFDGLIGQDPILLLMPSIGKIEAVGALKIPNSGYKLRVFKKARTTENPDEFKYELGWIVSLSKGKGNGQKILRILTEYSNCLYATVRKDNERMKHILQKFGFKKAGSPYLSLREDYKLELFVLG